MLGRAGRVRHALAKVSANQGLSNMEPYRKTETFGIIWNHTVNKNGSIFPSCWREALVEPSR